MDEDKEYNIFVMNSGKVKVFIEGSPYGGPVYYRTGRLFGFFGSGSSPTLALDDLEYKIQRYIEAALNFREAGRV